MSNLKIFIAGFFLLAIGSLGFLASIFVNGPTFACLVMAIIGLILVFLSFNGIKKFLYEEQTQEKGSDGQSNTYR